jgi:DNA-binding response OmpR family regulator
MKTLVAGSGYNTAIASIPGQTNLGSRILVVDDDSEARRVSVETLIRDGYRVDSAEDGAAGWAALRAANYALLLTDHKMPKVSGIELIKLLRSARMSVPVVLVSGALPAEELERHPWLQLSAILEKPFSSDQLLTVVEGVLRAHHPGSTPLTPLTPGFSPTS